MLPALSRAQTEEAAQQFDAEFGAERLAQELYSAGQLWRLRMELELLEETYAAEKGEAWRREALAGRGTRSAGISVRKRIAAAPVELICVCFDDYLEFELR
ncbi:hypothetical protein V490_06975 [Pseudogymnoascus sp. VKM F-3557]|nr:hypothetical protein V490_06975 [Pseudogymnoascus sp. VKM F-3557]